MASISNSAPPFQILSLSGGGYMGLYTARVLQRLEEHSGRPLRESFDLIAGTSIGGIIALGLAAGTPAAKICTHFYEHGPRIFPARLDTRFVFARLLSQIFCGASYSPAPLKDAIDAVLGSDIRIDQLGQRVIIPTVNMTSGAPQVFKTPHHPSFVRDGALSCIDVALATSAAPTFFPLHKINDQRYSDGGLYANSPDFMALHEAKTFLGAPENMRILSVGTTTARFSISSRRPLNMGIGGWMKDLLLTRAMIGAQQGVTDFMMKHALGNDYFRIDEIPSKEQSRDLQLDRASDAATQCLLGLAEVSSQKALGITEIRDWLGHQAPLQEFTRRVG